MEILIGTMVSSELLPDKREKTEFGNYQIPFFLSKFYTNQYPSFCGKTAPELASIT